MFPNTIIDRFALTVAVIGQALPNFFFALIMIIVFGVWLRWLPISGHASWQLHHAFHCAWLLCDPSDHATDPAGMMDVLVGLHSYGRAKGLKPRIVLFKHALRNAIIPVVSFSAVQLGFMLGGSIIVGRSSL